MVGDMFLMHELGGILRAQYDRLIMAFTTFPLGDMAIPPHNTEMTFLTSHPSGDILPMIKIPTFDFNIPFGFDMTRSTTPYGTRNAFLFSSWASPVKVTNKTVGFVNGEMQPLNELSMARGATKPHSSPQLTQMPFMRKADILKYHIPFQVICFVTPIL
jgi:hypothetical protein